MLDLVFAGFRVFVEQLFGHQDESRRAEAALEGTAFDEGLLHGIEPFAWSQPLDRIDPRAVGRSRQEQAKKGKGSYRREASRNWEASFVMAA